MDPITTTRTTQQIHLEELAIHRDIADAKRLLCNARNELHAVRNRLRDERETLDPEERDDLRAQLANLQASTGEITQAISDLETVKVTLAGEWREARKAEVEARREARMRETDAASATGRSFEREFVRMAKTLLSTAAYIKLINATHRAVEERIPDADAFPTTPAESA